MGPKKKHMTLRYKRTATEKDPPSLCPIYAYQTSLVIITRGYFLMKNPQLQHLFVESESPMLALGIHIKTHKLIFMHSNV